MIARIRFQHIFVKNPPHQHQDKCLREGVKLFKSNGGWKRVAEFVQRARTPKQCEIRYNNALRHVDAGLSIDVTWSKAEVYVTKKIIMYSTLY